MRSCGDSCSRAVRSTDSLESGSRSHVNRNLRPAVTQTPNSQTITPPGRLAGVGGYLGSYLPFMVTAQVAEGSCQAQVINQLCRAGCHGLEQIPALLSGGRDQRPDNGKVLGASLGAEAA